MLCVCVCGIDLVRGMVAKLDWIFVKADDCVNCSVELVCSGFVITPCVCFGMFVCVCGFCCFLC